VRSTTPSAACDAQIDRGFFNTFQLQTSIEITLDARITPRRFPVGLNEQILHRTFRRTIANDHKIPGLHESYRSDMVRRRQ
jgi:hypothetical protein